MSTTPGRAGGSGGVPDGLIVGILGLLLGTTAAVWLATETAEFATHGHAPHPLRFSATPVAIRHLALAPNNLPAAWPDTPAGQLPSATAFWTSFFLLLAALLLLFLATLAVRARLSAPRPAPTVPADGWNAAAKVPAARRPRSPVTAHPSPRSGPPSADGTSTAAPSPGPWATGSGDPPPAPRHGSPAEEPPSATRAPGAAAGPRPQEAGLHAAWTADGRAPGQGVSCLLVPDLAARSAKRGLLAETARRARGPLVVVTADPALWELRPAHRDAALYDPGHLIADTPGLAWAPVAGCADPAVAAARARALLAPAVRPEGDTAAAERLLTDWLHDAARDGRSIRQVARRAARPDAPEPVRDALACLEELHVLKSCLPSGSPQDSLELDAVLSGRRPLYLLGTASETRVRAADHSTMPLLTALLDVLLDALSEARPSPEVTLVLDDLAAVAPAPDLHRLLELGAGTGVVVTFRSFEQARARWGADAVHSLWTKADHRATLQDGLPREPAGGDSPSY